MTVYPYASTHLIQHIGSGKIRKDLSASGRMTPVSPRPGLIEDPTREPAAYRNVLAPLEIGPRLFDSGHDWVVLEQIDAPELWQIGDIDIWAGVVRWVAQMHLTLADSIDRCDRVPLLSYDAGLYRIWRERAADNGLPRTIVEAHRRATDRLLQLPDVVLHGDLYASNLLVEHKGGIKVWPVDWELMGTGPAVLDLAALTAGSWSTDSRLMMAREYFDTAHYPRVDSERLEDLRAARLHLCIQWIGADPEWIAPPAHRHDWMAEAQDLAAVI